MKPKVTTPIILLCGLIVATAAYGQSVDIWTGGINGTNTGTDIGQSNNWGGTLPNVSSPTIGDIAEWNGTAPGDLSLVYDTITETSGPGFSGLNFYLNSSQTGSVSISTDLTLLPTIAVQNISIDSGAGAFTFGGRDSGHMLNWVGRPAGAVHSLLNNSTNTATLTPWIEYSSGGGVIWKMAFAGTGNWECDSYLVDYGGVDRLLEVDGPGTVFWNPVGYLGFNGFVSPINIIGGTLVLMNPHPRLNSQAITLYGNFTFAMTNSAAAQSLSGVISGAGTLLVNGGTLTLTGTNTYTGATTISNGTLATFAVGGNMNVSGGTLAPGGLGSVGKLTVANNLSISAGTILATLNKSQSQSNSLISVTGPINYSGGMLKLVNAGPNLVVGDKFKIFNKPVPGGAAMPIISSGFTVANNLATDGSVTVASVVTLAPPTLNKIAFSGANLMITATNNLGASGTYSLLATNDPTAPLATWPVIRTGSFESNGNLSITNPIGANQMFFILRVP